MKETSSMDSLSERVAELIQVTENNQVRDQSARKMLRDAIAASGLNNFENILNAVEEFLCNIQLFDPAVAFGRAADALGMAALAFALIDNNHDRYLSHHELGAYANRLDDQSKALLEWVLCHYEAIEKAGLVHKARGISRFDLASAAGVFRGMEYVHANFDKITPQNGDRNSKTLTHSDILHYLDGEGASIDRQWQKGLVHLARYLRKLEMRHPGGFSEVELDDITPEMLWTG
jgi:hypothetical protein